MAGTLIDALRGNYNYPTSVYNAPMDPRTQQQIQQGIQGGAYSGSGPTPYSPYGGLPRPMMPPPPPPKPPGPQGFLGPEEADLGAAAGGSGLPMPPGTPMNVPIPQPRPQMGAPMPAGGPAPAGQPASASPGNVLSGVMGGLQANSDALLFGGLGLMAGGREGLMRGMMAGTATDRKRQSDQDAKDQDRKAREGLAKQFPQYAGMIMDAGTFSNATEAMRYIQQSEQNAAANKRADQQLSLQERRLDYDMNGGKNNFERDVAERQKQAERLGLKPDDPAYKPYVLAGKFPREDAQPLTATDKKAIMEADEGVLAANNAIASLKRAQDLSKTAFDGTTAGVRGWVGSQFGNQAATDTVLLNNEMTYNALTQLKTIFGSAPTEGERQILLDLQGSANLPQAAREAIYKRAIEMAEAKLAANQQRANELRGGSYYKTGGGSAYGGSATGTVDLGNGVSMTPKK